MQIPRVTLLALLVVASPRPAAAQAPVSLEAVAARYLAAQTYCETGKSYFPIPGEVAFSLCADRAGHFKYVENVGRPQETVQWSEGPVVHSYRQDTRAYGEYRRDVPRAHHEGFAPGRPPGAMSRLLRESLFRGETLDSPWPLRRFEFSPTLSLPTESVFERVPAAGLSERLWVRNADGVMTRYEHVGADGKRQHFVELSSVRLDGPLTAADLSFSPGLLARYSLQNSPAVFLAAVLALCTAVAGLVWARVLARAEQPERIARLRGTAWRWWRRALAVTAPLLAVLTVLAILSPGSGHPPAIVVPIGLAMLAGLVFAFWACLLLASYPVQWLIARSNTGRATKS